MMNIQDTIAEVDTKTLEKENSSLKAKIEQLRSNNNSFLYSALVKAQAQFPVIPKRSKSYNGMYADLPDIFRVILPILNRYGLSVMQPVLTDENGNKSIKTILCHTSGQSIEDTFNIIVEDDPKKIKNILHANGASITYFRRYCFASMLCIAADEDTDGN